MQIKCSVTKSKVSRVTFGKMSWKVEMLPHQVEKAEVEDVREPGLCVESEPAAGLPREMSGQRTQES